jgi:alpha-tubulin suppressor-like RCC1 family protein
MAKFPSGYQFPILDSSGAPTSTIVDVADMFARKELFLNSGLWAWGENTYGQLGLGNTTSYSSPVQVGSLTNWKQISMGYYSNLGIKTDGTLWSWGWNFQGELGLNDTSNRNSPVQVGSLTNWKQISNGSYSILAIKTDGTLWAWGLNDKGQLGLGNTTPYSSPVQVGSLTNWKTVSCGYTTAVAIKTDGTLWAWGQNAYGGLGLGNTTSYSSPIQVGSLTGWKSAISINNAFVAIKTDGTLWSCGYNASGQLGLGNTTPYSSPVQVGSLTNWKQISPSAGYSSRFYHAIKTDGTLWGWGYNASGQLGLGDLNSRSSPVQVGSLTNWKQISSSYAGNVAAVKTDGTLWAWGDNNSGENGQNDRGVIRSSPVQVGSLSNWKFVSSSSESCLAIQAPDLP